MMFRKLFLKLFFMAIVPVSVFSLGGNGFAQNDNNRGPHVEGGASGMDFMNRFDLDKDGKISHREWEEVKPSTVYREKHWPAYDKTAIGPSPWMKFR